MKNILSIYNKFAPELSQGYEQQIPYHSKGIKEFTRFLPKKAKVLDLGCGMGTDVSIFNKLGFEAVGIDGSVGMIKEARNRYPNEKFYISDIRRLELPVNSFDAVWSWSVLTHLNTEDKRIVLKKITEVLKTGGIFSQTIWKGSGVFINKNVYPRTHYLLSVSSWKKLYKEAGFSPPLIKYIKGKGNDSIRLTAKKSSG